MCNYATLCTYAQLYNYAPVHKYAWLHEIVPGNESRVSLVSLVRVSWVTACIKVRKFCMFCACCMTAPSVI